MVEQGLMAMASSSSKFNYTLMPTNIATSSGYLLYPSPLATYEEVVASPDKFRVTLEKLHAVMGSKFMIPTIGGQELDLHRLFVEVTSRGGLAKTLKDKRWREIIVVFSFPSSATNASFILRKYYHSLLIHYEQLYFFRARSWDPDTIKALQSSSRRPAPLQQSSEPLLSSSTSQAGESNAFGINITKSLPEACLAAAGSLVNGIIDGKFENGYLITVRIGSEDFRGVLYEIELEASQKVEQRQIASTSNNSNSASTSRRKRRNKSERKKRDPVHPKPNRSGYNFFFAEQYKRLKQLHPGKEREISSMIGELWNKLNEPEKSIYQEKAAKDKERYRMEKEAYRERLRTGHTISNALSIQHVPTEKLENKDGNDPRAPGNAKTPSDSVPMQLQSLRQEISVVDLDKNVDAHGEISYPTMLESSTSSSNRTDKSSLDANTSQILDDGIPVQQQQQCHVTDANMIDLEKELKADGANSPPTMLHNASSSTTT